MTVVEVPEAGLNDRRFEDFFVFEYPRLVSALQFVTGDAERARDAVDEACARACERLSRGRSIDVLGAWIRVVAFNVARDRLRRRRSERLTRDRLAPRPRNRDEDLSTSVADAIDVRVALALLPREGLASAADATSPTTDPAARVAERVRRRRRARTMRTAITVAATALGIVVAVSFARDRRSTEVATAPPVAVVRVEVLVGGQLTIHFPGRAVSGQPPHVELPRGVIRFEVRSGSGAADRVVIDGVPRFAAVVGSTHEAAETVRIPPGRYLMHSTISGHSEAGEEAVLVVK